MVMDHSAFGVMLLTNAVLKGESITDDHIADNEKHIRQLRALASVNALTALEAALRPRTLENSVDPSKRKIVSLILRIALTIEVLLSAPPHGVLTPAPSNNKTLNNMHEHLGLLLVHYLHHLCLKTFSPDSKLFSCFGNAGGNVSLSRSFWLALESELSSLPEPPMTIPASRALSNAEYLSFILPGISEMVLTAKE